MRISAYNPTRLPVQLLYCVFPLREICTSRAQFKKNPPCNSSQTLGTPLIFDALSNVNHRFGCKIFNQKSRTHRHTHTDRRHTSNFTCHLLSVCNKYECGAHKTSPRIYRVLRTDDFLALANESWRTDIRFDWN